MLERHSDRSFRGHSVAGRTPRRNAGAFRLSGARRAMPYTDYLRQRAETCRKLAATSKPEDAQPLEELAGEYERWALMFAKRRSRPLNPYHRHH